MFTKLLFKEVTIFNKRVPIVFIGWFLLAAFAVVAEILRHSINNYQIYAGVFTHTLNRTNLFVDYSNEYFDQNHYGPLFSIVIAPFAIFPKWLGCFLWSMVNAAVLLYAIRKLKIPKKHQVIIVAITAIEMMTATHNVQYNPMLAAWLILAYVLVEKEHDFWATLFIAIGFFTKLYGVAGLLFFVFSTHKVKFSLSFLFWCMVLFVLPMAISSPSFVVQSYQDWYQSLVEKNLKNEDVISSGGMQDISVGGMISRITGSNSFNVLTILIPAVILVSAPLLRFKQYASERFRLSYLAIVLITVVIFSSSAESPTYVIAVAGVGIWYVINFDQGRKWTLPVLIFVLLLTSLSPTDLFPPYVRQHFIKAYALKALPCFVVWIWLIADVIFTDFRADYKRLQDAT